LIIRPGDLPNILIFQHGPIELQLKDKDVFLMRAMLIESGVETQKARPFLKWAGGKTQLLDEIDARLPHKENESGQIDTYIEPFVGGGALFFHVAQKCPQFGRFLLFDINEDLVNCYNTIKNEPEMLIGELRRLERRYHKTGETGRKALFYVIRDEFNLDRSPAKLIFLNKTCYNGLYRVNKSNEFNVPFGGYKNPKICDKENLMSASIVLQNAEVIAADFEESERYINKNCFVYLDPPYRPISPTASFTSYAKGDFSEADQIRLSEFCRIVNEKGAKFLLSNSCPNDNFFRRMYRGFNTEKVKAVRAINCIGNGRGEIDELIITNYR
jgi:DNA adenine methylase